MERAWEGFKKRFMSYGGGGGAEEEEERVSIGAESTFVPVE